MNHLFRERAPITPAGWAEIEKEAKRTLKALLEIFCLVPAHGPLVRAKTKLILSQAARLAAACAGDNS